MFSSPIFTVTSILTLLCLLAVIVMQVLEMKCYAMF
ncbi:MAG: hypothetical protein BWY31_02708 [Lentisphaerae bacterium ADurb.Bin242]|nr:MAG: hypothetical protein BWY31_02708 [Lentisphaerae bacterium ADurb.Bin242]